MEYDQERVESDASEEMAASEKCAQARVSADSSLELESESDFSLAATMKQYMLRGWS